MSEFILSNSKLRDWETMCPIQFKAKHIDKTIVFKPTIAMKWGSYFETLVLGGGIGGAFNMKTDEDGPKMERSVFYDRVRTQAERAILLLKAYGGKTLSRQEYIRTEVRDAAGQLIPIEGTLDRRSFIEELNRQCVIDIKFTMDTENDFGDYGWGNAKGMDLSQIVHYGLLVHLKHRVDYPITKYWVFDSKPEMKYKPIDVVVSEGAIYNHIERCSTVYNQIMTSIVMDDWQPHNTFKNCSVCPVKCKYERTVPEEEIIEL